MSAFRNRKRNINRDLIKLSKSECFVILACIHAIFLYVMNIYCMKPLSFGLPFVVMDAGYLLSWSIPVIINIITECYGEKKAKFVTVISIIIAIVLSFISSIIIFIPTTKNYYEQAIHFRYIFGSNIRVNVASMIAFATGNFVNIYLISSFKGNTKTNSSKIIFVRGIFASLISQFVDNAIFETLAFLPIGLNRYEMKFIDIITAVISCTFIEIFIELLFFYPITIFVTKKIENMKV